MIHLIGGDNSYESQRALNELVASYADKGFAVKNAYISEQSEFNSVFNSFGNLGMFETKQAIVLKALDEAKKEEQERLLDLLSEQSEGQEIIIYSRTKFDKRSKLYKFIKTKGKIMDFAPLKGYELEKWLSGLVSSSGMKLSRDIIYDLILRVGEDQDILASEISKLEALDSEGIKINKEVAEQVFADTLSIQVWDLVDALNTNKAKSLLILDRLMKNSQYEQIMGLLARQIRLMYLTALTRNKDKLTSLGVHPFIASKLLANSSKLNLDRIKKIYQKMVNIEIAVRNGKFDKMLALDLLVIAF